MSAALYHVFGFHCGIKHGINFHGDKTVVFLAGQMCILHDIESNHQRFLQLPELGTPTCMTKGPKNFIAVADINLTPKVTLYDLESSVKKVLPEPEIECTEYLSLSFSSDFKYLAAQGGPPDWPMAVWIWDKRTIKTIYIPTAMKPGAEISEICFHPRDNDQMVAVGKKYFRLYKFEEEEGFKPFIFAKQESEGDCLSIGWLPRERLAIGTSNGTLLFFDGVELRYEITVIDKFAEDSDEKSKDAHETDEDSTPITQMVVTSNGIICTFGNQVVVHYVRSADGKEYFFQRSIHLPRKNGNVQIELGEVSIPEDYITDLKRSPDGQQIAVCTNVGQIFYYSLDSKGGPGKEYFRVVTQPVHRHNLIALDIAVTQPLIASASQRTLRIWNYIKHETIMCKNFYDDILCVAIHPLGFFLLIGFVEYIRVFAIVTNGLKELAVIQCQQCSEAAYAHGGHYFAITNGSQVEIFDFITLEMIMQCRGHHGKVTSLAWNQNDTMVISCDDKGALYVWNVVLKWRIAENVVKGISYSSVVVSPDGKCAYAVGTDCMIREIVGSDIVKEAPTHIELTTLSMSHSGTMLFGGTVTGCLRSFHFPLSAAATAIDTPTHLGRLAKVKTAYGDKYLITSGCDGMLCIWKITDKKQVAKFVPNFSNAILINASDLTKHLDTIKELQRELHEMQWNGEYQLELKDMYYNEKHTALCNELMQRIADLNVKITVLSNEKRLIKSTAKEKCIRVQELTKANFEKIEKSTREELLKVYKTYEGSIAEYQNSEESLRNNLQEITQRINVTTNTITEVYEKKLQELQIIIDRDAQFLIDKEEQYRECCKQLEDEADRLIIEIKEGFESSYSEKLLKVKDRKEENEILKDRILNQEQEMKDLKERITRSILEEDKLKIVVSDLDRELKDTLKVKEEKDNFIKQLQGNVFDLNQKKQVLEKHEFVLTALLKTQMEEKQVLVADAIIQKLQNRLETLQNTEKKRKQEIEATEEKTRTVRQDLDKERIKTMNLGVILKRYKSHLWNCNSFIQDPAKLRQTVKNLIKKYVSSELTQTKDASTTISILMTNELDYQKEHLSKTIDTIKSYVMKEKKRHNCEYARLLQENAVDIGIFYELQDKLRIVTRHLDDVELTLGLGKKGAVDRVVRLKLEAVINSVKKQTQLDSCHVTGLDQIKLIIAMQQESIQELIAECSTKQIELSSIK